MRTVSDKKRKRLSKINYRNRLKNKEKKQVTRNTTKAKQKEYFTTYYSLLVGNFLFKNNIPVDELRTVNQIVYQASKYTNAPYTNNSMEYLSNFIETNDIKLSIHDADKFLSIGHTSHNMINNFAKLKRYLFK